MVLGCHSLRATSASLQPRWHPADLGDITGDLPLLTVPCEMRSGSSSSGLRGPLPFVRGHFGTAHRHRPSLRLHIPDVGPFLRSLCHLVGPAPTTRRVSERSRAGRRRPAQPAAEGTHTGNAKVLLERSSGQRGSLTETPREGRQPHGPQDTQHPKLQPHSSSSHHPEIQLLAPVLCPACHGNAMCQGFLGWTEC